MRLVGGLFSLWVAGAAAAAPPVPLKDFVRRAEFESAKLSPTGEYLAVAMPIEGQTMLGIVNLKTRKVAGSLRWRLGDHVSDYAWVSPQRVVASMARRAGPLDQPEETGQILGINVDGSSYLPLMGGSVLMDGLPREPDWTLIYKFWVEGRYRWRASIERLHVYSGGTKRVATIPGTVPLDVVADRHGQVRFSYSTDNDGEFHLYAFDGAEDWKEVNHPHGPPEDITLHGATADGTKVLLTSAEASGRECLREYRLDTASLSDIRCADVGAVGWPLVAFEGDALIGLVHNAGRRSVEFLQPEHPDARFLAALYKTFEGQSLAVTSRTLDDSRVVVSVWSDRNPGDFYLVDRSTMKAEHLMSQRAWIDPAVMTSVAPLSYKARDGVTIHGYLTARDGLNARKAPLVLMPHGGPHGVRDYWEWDSWAQALASRGYAVLQVNFRGSGGLGYAHEQAGYARWGTLMQDDLTDAVRWAIEQGIADAGRVCVMGASYGGYAALMSAVREPDLYRCAISLAGIYDLEEHTKYWSGSEVARKTRAELFGTKEQRRANSPVTYLDRLRIPVLIAHGTADGRVDFKQAKLLRKLLKEAGKPHEWLQYQGEGHGFWKEANHEDFLAKSLAFLDKHIGVATTPPAATTQSQ